MRRGTHESNETGETPHSEWKKVRTSTEGTGRRPRAGALLLIATAFLSTTMGVAWAGVGSPVPAMYVMSVVAAGLLVHVRAAATVALRGLAEWVARDDHRVPPADVVLRMRGVRKRFGGVRALDGVDLEVRRGEVHALLIGDVDREKGRLRAFLVTAPKRAFAGKWSCGASRRTTPSG